jgi:hypothetical protein
MRAHQVDESGWRIRAQRKPRKPWIGTAESLEPVAFEIGEVAAATARDADFFGASIAVIDQEHPQSALAGYRRAHEAGGTAANDREVVRER